MTERELQLKAVALRRSAAGPAFQPEGLMEHSPGLRGALPWVCAPQNSLHPALAPLQGAKRFRSLTQGSSRCAPTTLGCIPFALQAINQAALHCKSSKRKFPRVPFRVVGVFRGKNLFP